MLSESTNATSIEKWLYSEPLSARTPSQRTYEYTKLQNDHSTRLLKIGDVKQINRKGYSVEDFENVHPRYEIVEADLNNLPEYETVSYAWESPVKDRFIRVGENEILLVTTSLAAALLRFIECSTTEYLWIDQICNESLV